MGNREIAKFGVEAPVESIGEASVFLREVQSRIEAYYSCLGKDLEFDVEVAQEAEQAAIRKMAELNSGGIRSRELRQNMLAISRFRQRTHESLVRVAEVLRAKEAASQQTNVQINFTEKRVDDEELFEALGVLQSAGVLDAGVSEGASEMLRPESSAAEPIDIEGVSDGVQQDECEGEQGRSEGNGEQGCSADEGNEEAVEAIQDEEG